MFLVGKVPLVMINSFMRLRFRCVLSMAFFTDEEPSTALMLLLHFLSVLLSEVAQFTARQKDMHRLSSKAALFKAYFKTYQAGSCRWNCSCRVSVLHQCRLRCSGKAGSDRHQILHTGNPYMHLHTHKKMLPKKKQDM